MFLCFNYCTGVSFHLHASRITLHTRCTSCARNLKFTKVGADVDFADNFLFGFLGKKGIV